MHLSLDTVYHPFSKLLVSMGIKITTGTQILIQTLSIATGLLKENGTLSKLAKSTIVETIFITLLSMVKLCIR